MKLFRFYIARRLLVLSAIDAAGLYLSISVGFLFSYAEWRDGSLLSAHWVEGAIFVAATGAAAFTMGLYKVEYMQDKRMLALRLAVALVLAFISLSVLFYLAPHMRIWLSAMVPGLVLSFAVLWGARAAFLSVAHAGVLQRRVLVIGAGEQARRLEELEVSRRPSTFLCAGFIPVGTEGIAVSPRRVMRANNLLLQCEELRVDEIVVAVRDRRATLPTEDLLECRLRGIPVSSLSGFFERELGQIDIETLYPSWLIFSSAPAGGRIERGVKRFVDVALSIGLILFTLPVLAATALAIFVEDGRPIFYRQERVGLNGRRFHVIKFRSMRVDAERDGRARWAAEGDPRVTRVGAVIRKTRIDEIPQILNVLAGEMSFVGPRPERPAIIEDLVKEIPFYTYRHVVRPGITGWAQVNYPYGASVDDAKQKLKFDLFYVRNGGLLLDLVILMQTVRVVLWPQGVR